MNDSTYPPLQLSPKAEEILQRTSELLARGGYASFSYADIADLVHVRKASIHHHFPTKADLVKATVARHCEAIRKGLRSLDESTPDPLQRLESYCLWWAACIEASAPPICICALLAAELPTIPMEVADLVRGHFEELSAWIAAVMQQGRSSGRIHPAIEPSTEALAFMSCIHGGMLAARALGDSGAFRKVAERSLDRLKP